MSVDKLKAKAAQVFKADKKLDKVFVTEDGNVFQSKSYADLHANTSNKNKKQKVFEFTAKDVGTPAKKAPAKKAPVKKGNAGSDSPEKRGDDTEGDKKE